MQIYYATVFDSRDVHSWSGLCFNIRQMLQEQAHEVKYLDNLKLPNAFFHGAKKLVLKYVGKTYSPYFTIKVAKEYARQIREQVPIGSIIFSPNVILLSQLGKSYKKVLFTDCTFDNLLNFYPSFSNIDKRYIEQAREIEYKALHEADLLIYTSRWAAESAKKVYRVDPRKISIASFGSNIDQAASEEELDQIILNRKADETVHLLFIAASWYRKGGDYAIEVLNRLLAMGIKAKLHVVGMCNLPTHLDMVHVKNHGFISKSGKDGHQYMVSLFKQAHFLLLPSRADCTPVSVSEANSFGLPCLISTVGGNREVVKKGMNGSVFDFTKGPGLCADYISYHRDNADLFDKLCRSSYQHYTNELNWEVTGRKITHLLKSLSCESSV